MRFSISAFLVVFALWAPCSLVAQVDQDQDGVFTPDDCDDNNAALFPGAPCSDGNACTSNDSLNASCQCISGPSTVCDDGNPCTIDTCNPATGCVFIPAPATTQCDDGNPLTNSDHCDGAGNCIGILVPPIEICDGLDNNGNGQIDEGFETYADSDGDGFGDPNIIMPCDTPGVANNSDCDDTIPLITIALDYYFDLDGDGFGDPGATVTSCTQAPGMVLLGGDCDDTDATAFAGSTIGWNCEGCSPAALTFMAQNQYAGAGYEEFTNTFGNGTCGANGQLSFLECLFIANPAIFADIPLDGVCFSCFLEYWECSGSNCLNACGSQGEQSQLCFDCLRTSSCGIAFMACSGLTDADGDGVFTQNDCDDNNPTVGTGLPELCGDGLDNNCNNFPDEGFADGEACDHPDPCVTEAVYQNCTCVAINFSPDSDGDAACDAVDDCDTNPLLVDAPLWYFDTDGDGYGGATPFIASCVQPITGMITVGGDCDDQDPLINPDAIDLCGDGLDNNCDGILDNALEVCNGVDDDCDGLLDEEGNFADLDGDGHGDANAPLPCGDPAGVPSSDDCNDSYITVHPEAAEVCDGLDNDCDGLSDEGMETYADNDGDGFGDPQVIMPCDTPGVANNLDCDDDDANVFPGQGCGLCSAADIALLVSNPNGIAPEQGCFLDCSGSPDPIACVAQCYVNEGLSLGCATCAVEFQFCVAAQCAICATEPNSAACIQCQQTAGCAATFSACSGLVDADSDGAFAPFDCDDTNALVYPDAPEGCTVDGLDNDCDGLVDEDALVDADGDGFTLCTGDCNDLNDAVHPNATEICDGIDNNCVSGIDEGFPAHYQDLDGDGFGNPNIPGTCGDPGSTTDNTDCDDEDPTTHPTAPEICDGIDNDCNGTVDDNLAEDTDNDGFSPCLGDCDDLDATVFPGAPELCDGLDNDCNGFLELNIFADVDGDGFGDAASPLACGSAGVTNNTDCDDTDPAITLAPSWFVDADGDGFGTSGPVQADCDQPVGYAPNSFDCDDTNASIFPGQGCTECSPADLALLASNPFAAAPDQQCFLNCGNASDPQQCLGDCIADNGLSPACADCFAAYRVCLQAACPICLIDPENPACQQCVQNSGCTEGFSACSGLLDADNDGSFSPIDCDDANAAIYPDAAELCDGMDNNCNGQVDEGVAPLWFYDQDGDGFGVAETTLVACTQPIGYAPFDGDCDEYSTLINPGVLEICDGLDNNCDGQVDEGGSIDTDGDGVSDCVDECPSDPLKVTQGLCGCGVVDEDTNGNGICDSNETFPNVQLGVVEVSPGLLEFRLLPDGNYTGMFTASVITLRWPTTPGVFITGNDVVFVSSTMADAAGSLGYDGLHINGIYSYATFSTIGSFTLLGGPDAFIANTEKPFLRVPFVNTSGTCVDFEVVYDAYQDYDNLQWYISLSGFDRTNGYIAGETTTKGYSDALCQDIIVALDNAGSATITAEDLYTSSFANCGGIAASVSQSVFTCADIGDVPATLTVTYPNSFAPTCVSDVTVLDDMAPVITAGTIATCFATQVTAEAAALAATSATDNCGGITYTVSTTGSCATEITLTATDAHNNASSTVYTTRIDGDAPVVIEALSAVHRTVQCPDATGLSAALALAPTATDNCSTAPAMALVSDNTVGVACSYVRTRVWNFTDECGNVSSDFSQVITVVPVVSVSPRVFLDGPYDEASERMTDDLRFAGLLPLSQPFTAAPFNYAGDETVSPLVLALSNEDNAIVDWILVELRDNTTPTVIASQRAALVQRDGDVVDLDGTSPITFSNVASATYKIAVRHRNHLGAMTAGGVALSSTATSVDFTTSTLATYGTTAQKPLGGRMALWAGNAVVDNRLRYTGIGNDRDAILVRIGGVIPTNVIFNVYAKEDVNLDTYVKYTGLNNDRDPILVNIGGTVPTAQRYEQLP